MKFVSALIDDREEVVSDYLMFHKSAGSWKCT